MKNTELLIKPVSYDCNLECGYCFYKGTEKLYPGGSHRMDEAVLERVISRAFDYSDGGVAAFSWQGGEPLLAGADFYGKVFALQKKLGGAGRRVANSIQTNGALLDEGILGLIKEYNVFAGLSIDGNEAMHNRYRNRSFGAAMEAAGKLKARGIDFNVLTVINDFNAGRAEALYNFYREKGFEYVQFIPCFELGPAGRPALFSVKPSEYGKFLCSFFDLWHNDGNPEFGVRFFDNVLEALFGAEPGYCGFKDSCRDYLVVEYNGDVYPCDFFVRKEWKLGNIMENTLSELYERQLAGFSRLKSLVSPACASCEWFSICKGGCPKYRETAGGRYDAPDYFCEAYKKFFGYAAKRLKGMIRLRSGQ